MPNATVRANARTLPETTSHPDANISAVAAEFEAALQVYSAFYHGGGTDEEATAATNAVKAIAQKIIAVPGTDISTMRLKARVYLWAESTDVEKLAAEGGDWPSEAALASLFRDLGVTDLETTQGPSAIVDGAPAQHQARMNAPVSPADERALDLWDRWQEANKFFSSTDSEKGLDRLNEIEDELHEAMDASIHALAVVLMIEIGNPEQIAKRPIYSHLSLSGSSSESALKASSELIFIRCSACLVWRI